MPHRHKKSNFVKAMKNVTHPIAKTLDKVIEQPVKLADSIGHTAQGITGEIGLPLLIIGGIVFVAYLQNNI